jgi:type VI secretion system protein ImpK
MTPRFAEAVDPIVLRVLDLLDRIESNQEPSPSDERVEIVNLFTKADLKQGPADDWLLAKYALATWVDEVLIEAPWQGRQWWNENALEPELFGHRLAMEMFYEKAKLAAVTRRNRDALEVFYVAAVLGFRGLYRDPTDINSARSIQALGLPPDIESWAGQTAASIRLEVGRPPLGGVRRAHQGAPPLESKAGFVSYLLVGIVLLVANVVTYVLMYLPSSR